MLIGILAVKLLLPNDALHSTIKGDIVKSIFMTTIVVSPQQKDDAITTVCCPDNALCHASLEVSMATPLSPSSTSGNSLNYRNQQKS